jgi:hypothetical protein
MPALFTRDTNTPTTMSGANPFQSLDGAAKATGQENQMQEAQQHKQVLEKKAAADTKYVSLVEMWSRENSVARIGLRRTSRDGMDDDICVQFC